MSFIEIVEVLYTWTGGVQNISLSTEATGIMGP
jgi:hypothetical protein